MRLQIFVVLLLVAVAAGFVLLNPDIATETRSVQMPGAHLAAPILGITVLVAMGALVLMLILSAVEGIAHSRAQRRLNGRLAQRDHEIAVLKSAAYDRVAGTVEALNRELSTWMETEGHRRHEELQAQIVALQRILQARLGSDGERGPVTASMGARGELPDEAASRSSKGPVPPRHDLDEVASPSGPSVDSRRSEPAHAQ